MLRLRLLPIGFALLLACSDDPHGRILAAPPAPAPPPSPSPPPPLPPPPPPIEEHSDRELDRFVVSETEILVALSNDDELYVARTTDAGRTWTRSKVDVPDRHIWWARFASGGTRLEVEMMHGMNSSYAFTFATRDRGVSWKRLPGGGFRMNPPPEITSSSSSSRS